ncbi:MAG: hypothetical protein K9M99_11955 [Candidatus Cloacimonetes bacterium]|nr:hypothetical protein [Candidatus Cloacimonadota bacterium]
MSKIKDLHDYLSNRVPGCNEISTERGLLFLSGKYYDSPDKVRKFCQEWQDRFIHKISLGSRIPFTRIQRYILKESYSFKPVK